MDTCLMGETDDCFWMILTENAQTRQDSRGGAVTNVLRILADGLFRREGLSPGKKSEKCHGLTGCEACLSWRNDSDLHSQ
jgi:hypothetical protein